MANATGHCDDRDLTDLGVAVRSYRNLFYHRTVLLEGIRRMAMRNMAHLTDAREHCDAHASLEEDDWVPRVQAKMLSDQGLENNELNRTVIEWATFCLLQVYLALLYAEIESVVVEEHRAAALSDALVFHVPDHTKNPEHLDHAVAEVYHSSGSHIYRNLAAFFGVGHHAKNA